MAKTFFAPLLAAMIACTPVPVPTSKTFFAFFGILLEAILDEKENEESMGKYQF